MKKLLLFLGLAALAYWFVKDRLGGEQDEFAFTEATPAEGTEAPQVATAPPASG